MGCSSWLIFVQTVVLLAWSSRTSGLRAGPRLALRMHSVGIDLGTTFSLVSVVDNGKPVILPVDGERLVSSVVHYGGDGSILVGRAAEAVRSDDPLHTFSSVKRLVGRTVDQCKAARDFQSFRRQLVPIKPPNDPSGKDMCGLAGRGGNVLHPEEVLAEIIRKLLSRASEHYGSQPITNAVITAPAYFNDVQRAGIRRAGELANLQKIRLLHEPEAAALAYGLNVAEPQLVLVMDLGGGTFDVSVLEVGDGFVEVIATSGDGHLGGDDFDAILVSWIFSELLAKGTPKLYVDAMQSHPAVKNAALSLARATKIALSSAAQASVPLSAIWRLALEYKLVPGSSLSSLALPQALELSRGQFEQACEPLLRRLLRPIREVAIMAGVNLPGESGQFARDVRQESSQNSSEETRSPESNQRAGRLRARQSKQLRGVTGREIRRLQREMRDPSLAQFPNGQGLDDVVLVGGATRMPCIVQLVRTMTHIDPRRSIHPDEAVCLGAGVWSGILDGKLQQLNVLSSWQATLLRAAQGLK